MDTILLFPLINVSFPPCLFPYFPEKERKTKPSWKDEWEILLDSKKQWKSILPILVDYCEKKERKRV